MNKTEARDQGLETGEIKWFDTDKGYGFILPDSGARDVFLHASVVDKAAIRPAEGVRVAYKAVDGAKGTRAEAVHRLEGE